MDLSHSVHTCSLLPGLLLKLYPGKHQVSCSDLECPKDTYFYHLAHCHHIRLPSRPMLVPPGGHLAIGSRTWESSHPRSRSQGSCSRPSAQFTTWARGKARGGPKVKLLLSEDTGVCSLPRAGEPRETELRGNDFLQQTSLKADFPGGIQQGP